MRRLTSVIILLLFACVSTWSQVNPVVQPVVRSGVSSVVGIPAASSPADTDTTTFYVATDGNNDRYGGEPDSAWATLAYAVTQVEAHDTIWMLPGTHVISSEVAVPVKINIRGTDSTSILQSALASDWVLALESADEGTDGSQEIFNLKFDGDGLTGERVIVVSKRDSVKIHDCVFRDFENRGVQFSGAGWEAGGDVEPTTYATGNEFYDNRMSNCAIWTGGASRGSIEIGGQFGMKIYNNYIDDTERETSLACGSPIKFCQGGYLKALEIYNDTLIASDSSNATFACELWEVGQGSKIYGNYMEGWGLNIDEAHLEDSSYSVKIYENEFSNPARAASNSNTRGLSLDDEIVGLYAYKNLFSQLHLPIYINFDSIQSAKKINSRDIYIDYNIIDRVGKSGSWGKALTIVTTGTSHLNNFRFRNNTIWAGYGGVACDYGIDIGAGGDDWDTIVVTNNIVQTTFSGATRPIRFYDNWSYGTGAIDHAWVENDNMYGWGTNSPLYSITPGTLVDQNHQTTNPIFTDASGGNFNVQTGSPAINNGIDISGYLGDGDYDDVAIGSPPNIGAKETTEDP